MNWRIRPEAAGDEAAISEVVRAAFVAHPHSEQTEHHIVRALRAAGALAVSLVAELDGRVAGHIAFSPVTIADGSPGWYGLGPVAVAPPLQGRGIGRALIEQGLAALRARGAAGCVLLGERALYGRFGFAHDPRLVLADVPQEYFLALPFGKARPAGEVRYHPAFSARS